MKLPPDDAHTTVTSLWLLQRDDTPFLCLSFLASILLHGALFAVLAATRVFQPFTGQPGPFELVWFSLSAPESQQQAASHTVQQDEKGAAPGSPRGALPSHAVKNRAAHRPGSLPPPRLPVASGRTPAAEQAPVPA
ncbi:MAG: hypothetical protein GYA56_00500, partial [Geobacteraceae bacterium]|nr:hypothetical protein [Geobacteraceae bacterium]